MDNLFFQKIAPLAERIRPKSLDEVIGQEHVLGAGSYIDKSLKNGQINSLIFWGPPGIGKTTIAKIIAQSLGKQFYILSAINSGVKEIREVISNATNIGSAVVFIDEIHRFSKSQQDALLYAVESGIITLIGATTENPSFEVNAALLSRCQIVVLKVLSKEHLELLLRRALNKDKILSTLHIQIEENDALFRLSGGDARKLLNILEAVVAQQDGINKIINNENVLHAVSTKMTMYDKKGEMHYDIISAFIKSIRGSHPDAALYWLARMLEGGEDVKFIARRMLILSAEDIGLANPNALLIANSTFDAVHKIGMPEARIILSECTIYLATSSKSNSSYLAIDKAIAEVRHSGDLPVPLSIRNAPTGLMKELGYGDNYKYAHNYEGNFVDMEFLPSELKFTNFYNPAKNTKEQAIKDELILKWKKSYE